MEQTLKTSKFNLISFQFFSLIFTGNYLKTGKLGHKQIQQIDQNMDEHEVASIGKSDLKVSTYYYILQSFFLKI